MLKRMVLRFGLFDKSSSGGFGRLSVGAGAVTAAGAILQRILGLMHE